MSNISSANGAIKHPTPTVKNVIFGFTFDVSAKAISIGSEAIKENTNALLTGARNPSSRADCLNPKQCAKETPKKQRTISKMFLNPSTTSDGKNRLKSKKRIKCGKLLATTKTMVATAAYHLLEFGLLIVFISKLTAKSP